MKVCFNGNFYPAQSLLLPIQNRSFKWGDGVFETMKIFRGKLLLESFHFERLLISLQLIQINRAKDFTPEVILQNILHLCNENNCAASARVRLAVYRNEDGYAGYCIEAIPLEKKINEWQEQGQSLVLYPYARKSMDAFANIKTANFLPYILAQNYATEHQADDALLLNHNNHICDSTRANIFLIKGNEIFTPALHQGCINGVMRRLVMEQIKTMGFQLQLGEISEKQLLDAEEVFLTNAIQTIRWVKQYKDSTYVFTQTKKIFETVSALLFSEQPVFK